MKLASNPTGPRLIGLLLPAVQAAEPEPQPETAHGYKLTNVMLTSIQYDGSAG